MQKNLGGSVVNTQGNLYIQGDNTPGLADAPNNLHDFSNPISGDNNPRDGAQKDFALLFGASDATPTKLEPRNVTKITTASADQSVDGTFKSSGNTVTIPFKIPSSTTPANVSVVTDDGGLYHNSFNVQSESRTLATINGRGTSSVKAPGNSTLNIQVTGVPKNGADIYNINLRITTTTTQLVPVIDTDKLKVN